MKKTEANDAVLSNVEEDWLEDNFSDEDFGDGPGMDVMIEFLKLKSSTALELTKLVLEHCKIEKLSKKEVFNIFQEAVHATEKFTDLDANTTSA